MRILVLGAGAVGGYFGGRLLEKGEDVTFLVRKKRQKQLAEGGLVIKSIHGDVTFQPNTITAQDRVEPFDVVLFSTKAYHLKESMKDVEPFVGENTLIVPLLNGINHVKVLQEYFGEERVIGGLCFIETTLNEAGEVIQTSPIHELVFGEFSNEKTNRIQKLNDVFQGTKASFRLSTFISRDMWHKYLFITVLSGVTTLMRAPIGPIRETGHGKEMIEQVFNEVVEVMRVIGAPLAEDIVEKHMNTVEKMTYKMKSSMQRDMEKGFSIEGDHLQGYLVQVAKQHHIHTPLLNIIYHNLKVYEVGK
ncbi:2-dehydropantoate 2-reductase [Bacillus sp. CGMCC 1.16541]|uniref:2-dehydropantoate 2-reductase n=1 Tax=Bacillus sp. CGMCC 1.16541 TaxID=2185143 RepID=UPI000D730B93|nr:2-dehydropantoate 2-reductase [Bacillus sp. CGMCC 1.16541]